MVGRGHDQPDAEAHAPHGRDVPSVSLEGFPITNAIHPIHGGDWVLGLAVPDDTLDALLHEQLTQLVAVALACVLLALGLSHWLAGRIAQEIRRGRA